MMSKRPMAMGLLNHGRPLGVGEDNVNLNANAEAEEYE